MAAEPVLAPTPPARAGQQTDPSPVQAQATATTRGQRARLLENRLLIAIWIVGLLLTGLATWAAARADDSAQQRLLEVQTRQAAAVLSTAILTIQQPLTATVDAVRIVPGPRGAAVFQRVMGRQVGTQSTFVRASLWRTHGRSLKRMASVGPPESPSPDVEIRSFLRHALATETSVVRRIDVGGQERIAYALADAQSGVLVYAERPIPADRRAQVDRDSAFADIDYAIYLGPSTDTSAMTTTDVDPATLPLAGETYKTSVPFGDTVLTLVTSPRVHLGSALSRWLPWLLLAAGLVLTLAASLVAAKLLRARRRAEHDTQVITGLYERVDSLYGEQRALALSLQHALLPHADPAIPGLESAAEYVAGAHGVDIGGDWYSLIRIGADHFGFVVGDVSGNGVAAVAEMARARFTLRAYLLDGNTPEAALEKCSQQFDVATDGHIVTVLVGTGNVRTGELSLACAGHPPALLVNQQGCDFVTVPVGPPLGAGPSTYQPTTVRLRMGDTFIAYTDGLVERRGEDISVSMNRLVRRVARANDVALRAVVDDLLIAGQETGSSDDIAILALRRISA
jgi:serine phosphatase RsbU (regulator of sigma subunit)/type II secretory pathway pseudopilin PulG